MLDELGIKMVTIPLPFRLNHVNCFLAEGEDGWLVMDTGLNRTETKEIWKEQLEGKQVKDILVTHYHPDHSGYSGELQQETGARVLMNKRTASSRESVWTEDFINRIHMYHKAVGVPDEIATGIKNNTIDSKGHVLPNPKADVILNEGDRIKIGYYEYEVIFTPGHAEGLIVLYNEEKNVLLSTDHILPRITPNITYWFVGDQNPLQSYLESLKKVMQLNADYVVPSHGKPFYGANDRIAEIAAHHETRLNQILDFISEGKNVYEVCLDLFGDQLTVHEMRFAIGETLAHLEYLRQKGECRREVRKSDWLYMRG